MGFLKYLFFGSKPKTSADAQPIAQHKYMPEIKLPIDEQFTLQFKNNGGKFIYCENLDEIYKNFQHILEENDWEHKIAFVINGKLSSTFKTFNVTISKQIKDATFFITTCESLIANDGSILISSNQLLEKKLAELPKNFIVFATTSQIVDSIGEGLRNIKANTEQRIPTNITTIKHFKLENNAEHCKDFLTYGSSSKNLYLLLLEDL